MAVQYDKENGFTTWLSAFKKKNIKVCDEIKDLFKNVIPKFDDEIGWHDFFYDLNNSGIDEFLSKNKIANKDFKEFLSTIKASSFTLQDYQQWMVANGKATSTFANFATKAGSVIKSFGASLSSMAVNGAIGIAIQETLSTLQSENSELKQQLETIRLLNDEAKKIQRSTRILVH